MEPLAPGTEDDPLYSHVAKPSKKELGEQQALSKKAFLPNGKFDNIFELEYVLGAQHWYCRICECPVLGRFFNHEIGKRHVANLEKWNENVEGVKGDSTDQLEGGGSDMAPVVAPGEPLPPGFEGEVEKVALIQERLDSFHMSPLVGLEYLLELLDYDPSKEPLYLCILCDKKGDPRTVLTHLSSFNHLLMYLQKHFPTAYRHLAPYMIKVYKRNWQAGVQKIAEAIENTFGRLKPMVVEAGKFDKDRMHYIEMVAKGKHFSELSGNTFENVVTKEELTKVHAEQKSYDAIIPYRRGLQQTLQKRKSPSPPVVARPVKKQKPTPEKPKRRSLSPVSDISSSDLEDFDPAKLDQQYEKNQNRNTIGPRRERSPLNRRLSPPPQKRAMEGPMPWQKSNYGRGKPPPMAERKRDEKTEKMDEYKKLSKAIENDMEQVLKKHKQNPEKHPKYNDEWKKFWNKRYKELQAEGKNASTHDFKPEWIEFWNKRMQELHQEELKAKKMALRKRLGLPEEPAPISFKIGERRKIVDPGTKDNKPVPTAAQPDSDPEVIVIEDNEKDSNYSGTSHRYRNRSRSPAKRGAQFRRRSPSDRRDSPMSRRRNSPLSRRRESPVRMSPPTIRRSPPSIRRSSPLTRRSPHRRDSPSNRRASLSPPRRRSTERIRELKLSPPPMKISSPLRFSPPSKRDRDVSRRYSKDRSPGSDRYGVRVRERSRSRGRSRDVSWDRERERYRDYEGKPWERSYRKRDAAWETNSWDHAFNENMNPYAPPKVLRDVTREPVVVSSPIEDEDDGDVNIVGVLRLLTALEEKLGSLGPKVNELLGQALAMEKNVANSSENLLDNEMNCVLFETVKEKLKGQLQAGLVDRVQEKAFKNAIKKTAGLIHLASERKKKREVELPKKPVVVPGIGTVDKGKIARQIANALIAQGKTDVTQAELEQLINAVVGIAEAQKNTSQPLTTASFLEKLAAGSNTTEDSNGAAKIEDKQIETKDEKIEDEQDASTGSLEKSVINMEGLSDSDLQTLLQNFKDLSTDEQHGLINYLKKLEAKEPERVEKLRKFVNLTENIDEKTDSGRYSPFSNRAGSLNPASNTDAGKDDTGKKDEAKPATSFIAIDSEEEDYSFEDVAKAASQKVIEKEMEQKRIEEETKRETDDKNLSDAKALITSLMSSLNKNNPAPTLTESKESAAGKINIISNVPVSSSDLAKSLSSVTMSVSSLGSILGNVQNLTRQNQLEADGARPVVEKVNAFPQQMNNPPRNVYNEFDIDIQRGNTDFNLHQSTKPTRPMKSYDEFNIGPNPGEFRDDVRDPLRDTGFGVRRGPGIPNKPAGFPERGLAPLERSLPLDRNQPFSNVGAAAGLRGHLNQRDPSPPFQNSNQFQGRGGPLFNKMRPGGLGGFDQRGGDFRGGMNEPRRGGMTDFRGQGGDFRGQAGDFRGQGGDFRGQGGDFKGGPDFRDGPDDLRGRSDFRGNFRSEDVRGGPVPPRDGPPGRGGFVIDPHRLGNPAPPRFAGNFGGKNSFSNNYNKRW